jgi:hypothetical protein
LDSWEGQKREVEFRKVIHEIVSNSEKQRKDLVGLINSERFKERFFETYTELKGCVAEIENIVNESRERQPYFHEWRREAETISAEFKRLKD